MEISQIKEGIKVKDKYGVQYTIVDRFTHPFSGFTLIAQTGDIENCLLNCLDWDASDYELIAKEAK